VKKAEGRRKIETEQEGIKESSVGLAGHGEEGGSSSGHNEKKI